LLAEDEVTSSGCSFAPIHRDGVRDQLADTLQRKVPLLRTRSISFLAKLAVVGFPVGDAVAIGEKISPEAKLTVLLVDHVSNSPTTVPPVQSANLAPFAD